ncbi:MAG: VanZ family protein [Gammaproteobacteria bacterium]|nr:VanZ family protein [Gammaproteobacteria bacterium]
MLPLRFGMLWLSAGWLGVLGATVVSLSPSVPQVQFSFDDKLAHAFVYLLLMLWFAGIYKRRRYLLIAAGLFTMGVALELLQARIGRDLSGLDMLANLIGIVCGLALAWGALGGWCVKLESWLLAKT